MTHVPLDQTEATAVNARELAMPSSLQWSQKLSNDMVEHLIQLEQMEGKTLCSDPTTELQIMCEVLIKNVLGDTLDNIVQQASKIVPHSAEKSMETWTSQLFDAASDILSIKSKDLPESQTLGCALRIVAERAWMLTTDIAGERIPNWTVNVQFDDVLSKVLKDLICALVSDNESSQKSSSVEKTDDGVEIETSTPKDSSEATKFKSYSLFDLLDSNPKLAETMEKEPITAATVIDAYNKAPSAEGCTSGDPGLDRLEQAVGVLEKVERVQDLVAPSVSNVNGTDVEWKDILLILIEGLDLLQAVARQDENDEINEINEPSPETQGVTEGANLIPPFPDESEGMDVPTPMGGVTEELEDNDEMNPWGSALQEGEDALFRKKQIQVTSRFIQVHKALFDLCSRESVPTKGLAMSSCGNFCAQKYDLLHCLLRSVTAFFREDSYILLTLTDSRYAAKVQGNVSMIDDKESSSSEWELTEGECFLNLSCRPGLELGARVIHLCHELLSELSDDFCLLSGEQIDTLMIRYFTLLKTLPLPNLSLPDSSTTGSSSEGGEEKLVDSMFYLQPVHLLTALDPNAKLFAKLLRLIAPQQSLEYFKFTNLLNDIFLNSNPHADDDTLSSMQLQMASKSSQSTLEKMMGQLPQSDGNKPSKSGLTGAGFGAQHHVIYIVLEPYREGSSSGIRTQDLSHSHFSWSLTALKTCLYALQPHFPQEPTVHPLSRQLLRMDKVSTTESRPAEYGGLSVRKFEIVPLIEMGGEDNIALIMTFSRVWQMGIKSTDPRTLDSHLVDVCQDGLWRVIYSTLKLHESIFAAGMVHFFAISTTCGLCHDIGVNPLLGTTPSLLAVFRLCDRVLSTDPYHTTIPASASSIHLNTYENIVFENTQRVLTYVLNDKATLESIRASSLSKRQRALRSLTEIVLPMRWIRPRPDLGQPFTPLTAQWVLMIQVFMQVASLLGMQLESLLILANVLGYRPEGWWLVEYALKARRDTGSTRALKGKVPLLFNEWIAGAMSGELIDSSFLPLLCCIMASTSDISHHNGELLRRAAEYLITPSSISPQRKRELSHLSNLALSSFDAHFTVQDENAGESVTALIQAKYSLRCASYNLDTMCLLSHKGLIPQDDEGNQNKTTNGDNSSMDCDEEQIDVCTALFKKLCTGATKFDLVPIFKAAIEVDKRDADESQSNMQTDLSDFACAYWETAAKKINHFYLEATLTTGNVKLASLGQADASRFLYSTYLSEGTRRNSKEVICVDWFKVCVNAIAGGDCSFYEGFLESAKAEPGILFLWHRLHPNQISRKRYLFTVASGVHRVLGKEIPELAIALVDNGQCPAWAFIPTWAQQNFVGVVPFSEAVYILCMCMAKGVDYMVYYSVAILRHVQKTVALTAASSKLIHPSDLRDTQTFSAVETEEYVHELCKKHRPLLLELMSAAITSPENKSSSVPQPAT